MSDSAGPIYRLAAELAHEVADQRETVDWLAVKLLAALHDADEQRRVNVQLAERLAAASAVLGRVAEKRGAFCKRCSEELSRPLAVRVE